ncbi:MAG TPA: hypothetical protein DC046_17535 [Rhodospirillaceae bacterium]|nr:hypothetical protein [Rhodospirillaceae bacterium]
MFAPVMHVWNGLRKDEAFAPAWSVADLLKFPASTIPYFTVVESFDAPPTFIYRFWGTGHVDVKGIDYTGRAPAEHQPEEHGHAIDREFHMVVDERQALAFVHDLRPQADMTSLFQECLRLPFSNDGKTVTHVVSYSDWQTENEKWKRFFKIDRP